MIFLSLLSINSIKIALYREDLSDDKIKQLKNLIENNKVKIKMLNIEKI